MSQRKSLLSKLTGLFSRRDEQILPSAASPAKTAPPVDLNEPVTNPRLVAAIQSHQQAQTEETAVALFDELSRSVLLAGVVMDGAPERISDAEVLFRKGDELGLIEVRDDFDRTLLGLFTDWAELRQFTDEANSSLVMPAEDAMRFVLSNGYHGLVVNPASNASLRLDTTFIRTVLDDK